VIVVTEAIVSGLLEAIVSCGEEVAFDGFGAALGVRTGLLKSNTTDVLACEVLPTSSVAVSAIVLVPDPSVPVGVVV
jgi:hypothetical protein